MAAIEPVLGNLLLDVLLPNGASGTLTVGAGTYTQPFKLRYDSVRGTAATPGTDISSGGVSLAGLLTAAAASVSNVPTKANTGTASYTTGSSGTWNGCEVFSSDGTPKRVLYGPSSDLGKAFGVGDILAVNTGNLTGTVQ